MNPKLVGKHLHVGGYVYVRSRTTNGRMYWDCQKVRARECTARAITSEIQSHGSVTLIKGPDESRHEHPANGEAAEAEELTQRVKVQASAHPEMTPSQILRAELAGVRSGVLSQLPEQTALTRTMQRVRKAEMPPNPKKLADLGDLPARFTQTLSGDLFCIARHRA